MEKHYLTIMTSTRVEPETNALIRAMRQAQDMKGQLVVLGTKGSERRLQGSQVALFGEPERFMQFAQHGLLYLELAGSQRHAFAEHLDEHGLPVLLEAKELAFAKRSHEGLRKEEPKTLL